MGNPEKNWLPEHLTKTTVTVFLTVIGGGVLVLFVPPVQAALKSFLAFLVAPIEVWTGLLLLLVVLAVVPTWLFVRRSGNRFRRTSTTMTSWAFSFRGSDTATQARTPRSCFTPRWTESCA